VGFRRIFVPAGDVTAWPLNGEKLLPIESSEFHDLMIAANGSDQGVPHAVITEAAYSGRMRSDGSLAGHGTWTVQLRGEGPVVLPLSEHSLVIRGAHWQGEPQRPAKLGRWGANGAPAGDMGLEVTHSGIVEFDWQIVRQPADSGGSVAWRLPRALASRLALELPAGYQPAVEGGVILNSTALLRDDSEDNESRTWEVVLGPSPQALFGVTTADTSLVELVADVSLHEYIVYRVDERGLEIEATLNVDDSSAGLRELTLPLDSGVQFMSAEADGKELAWRVVISERTGATAVIAVPKAAAPRRVAITIRAWHPLVLHRPWQLPNLRPKGLFWTAGEIELSIAATLELQQLELTDCLQTGVIQSTGESRGPETCWLTASTPGSSAEITITPRAAAVAVRGITSLSLVEPILTGRLTTELSVTRGSVHALSGHIADEWNVQSVETIPANALGEWFLNRGEQGNHIEVQLTQAASASRKVAVVVTAQRPRPDPPEALSVDALRMVRWRDAEVTEQRLEFHTLEPYAAEPIGGLPRASSNDNPAEDSSVLSPPDSQAAIFRLDGAPDGAALRLIPKRAEYEVYTTLEARVHEHRLEQKYRLLISPRKSRIGQIIVCSNLPLGDAVRWSEEASRVQLTAVRLTSSDSLHSTLPGGGEAWLVRWTQPIASEVALIATRTTPITPRAQIPLLSVPEAAHQEGRLLLRAEHYDAVEIESAGLQSVPIPTAVERSVKPSDTTPLVAAFRYEPAHCQDVAHCPRAWITSERSDDPVRPVARRAALVSVFSADGRAIHRAELQLESLGARELHWRTPQGAEHVVVSLDGRVLVLPPAAAPAHDTLIPLPDSRKPSVLIVEFETHQAPLGAGSRLLSPLGDEVQVLSGDWTVWLPAEFSLADSSLLSTHAEFSLRRRLFGRFGREHDSPVFRPLNGSDWVRLANSVTGVIQLNAEARPQPSNESTRRANSSSHAIGPNEPFNADTEALAQRAEDSELAARAEPSTDDGNNQGSARSWSATGGAGALAGWRSYRTGFVAEGPPSLTVVHSSALMSWALVAFLLCFVTGGWLARWKLEVYVMCEAAAASAAILLPAAFSLPATGAFLGLLLSLIGIPPRAPVTADTPTKTWTQAIVTGALVLMAISVLARRTYAQPSTVDEQQASRAAGDYPAELRRSDPANPTATHSVMIPTGADGRPVGTKWYVGEQLLRELFMSARAGQMSGRDWLLRDMACEGDLRERAEGSGIVAREWKLIFAIDVMARDTTIFLPLLLREARWNSTASLDGIPAAISWNHDGRGCEIQVTEPGAYNLEFTFVPRVETVGERDSIELTIPAMAGGRVTVRYPASLARLETTGTVLSSVSGSTTGLLVRELDGSGRLRFSWPRADSPQEESQGLRVSELYWLHIDGSDVWLDAKYIVEGSTRRPETLTVAYDPAWRLRPSEDINSSPAREAGERSTVRVAIPPDDIDRQEVTIHWQLAQAISLGNLKLPPIGLTSLPATQRWFAVSSSEAMKCEILDQLDSLPGTPEEFLARWGESAIPGEPPPVVTRLDPDVTPALALRPRLAEPTTVESLQIAAGKDGLRVQFQCDVTPNGTDVFQFPLRVSEKLEIDEVILSRAGETIPLRWSRPGEQVLQIFCEQGLADEFRITVRGHVPRNESASYAVPRITAVGTSALQVQLYRDDDVLLRLERLTTTTRPDGQTLESPPPEWKGHVVGLFMVAPSSFTSARLTVTPNHVQTAGRTVTMLGREVDTWWATFACQLTVEQGELSVLRLRAPSNWVGPFEIQSGIPATVDITTSGEKQSMVLIRFSEPVRVGESLSLRLRGRALAEDAAPIAVPNIVSETPIRGPRYALVPSQLDGRTASWVESGVRPTLLPTQFTELSVGPELRKCYEITGLPFQVALLPAQFEQPDTNIRLADTRVDIGPFGGQLTVTQMIVVSSKLTHVTLEVPEHEELVAVTKDKKPVLSRRLGDRRWRISLGPPYLPQLIETVCRASRNEAAFDRGRFELHRPRLLNGEELIPVEVGLWSIGLPGRDHPQRHPEAPRHDTWSIEQAAVVTPMEQMTLRLDRLVSIANAAVPAATELPMPAGRDWYLAWAARLAAVRRHSISSAAAQSDRSTVPQVSSSSEEQLVKASQQLDSWIEQCDEIFETSASALRETSLAGQVDATPWEISLRPDSGSIYCVADGDAAQLTVHMENLAPTPRESKVRGFLAILVAAAAIILLMRRPAAYDLLYRWPLAVVFLLGTAWWAWLEPSWLGLLIAAVSVGLALRSGWPRRARPIEGSTVIRPVLPT
jgi:hypothetical protein